MIFANSRYEDTEKVYVDTPDGRERRQVVSFPRYYSARFIAKKHIVREDQRLDQIAALYYGDPESWWMISVANPEVFYPEEVPAGTVLRIPDAPSIL